MTREIDAFEFRARELLARAVESRWLKPDVSHAHTLKKIREDRLSDGVSFEAAIDAIKSALRAKSQDFF